MIREREIKRRWKEKRNRATRASHAETGKDRKRERVSPNAARKTRTGRNETTHTARRSNRNCRQLPRLSPLHPFPHPAERQFTRHARAIARLEGRTCSSPSLAVSLLRVASNSRLALLPSYSCPPIILRPLLRPSTVIPRLLTHAHGDHVRFRSKNPTRIPWISSGRWKMRWSKEQREVDFEIKSILYLSPTPQCQSMSLEKIYVAALINRLI